MANSIQEDLLSAKGMANTGYMYMYLDSIIQKNERYCKRGYDG